MLPVTANIVGSCVERSRIPHWDSITAVPISRRFTTVTPALNRADCTISPAPAVIRNSELAESTRRPVLSGIRPTPNMASLAMIPSRHTNAVSNGVTMSVIAGPRAVSISSDMSAQPATAKTAIPKQMPSRLIHRTPHLKQRYFRRRHCS